DVSDALLQCIENLNAAFEERVAVDRRLDALSAAVEKPHAERVFEIGDHLGNRGLRNAEVLRRFGHAAALNDRREHMQVPQLKPAPNLTFPVDFSHHREIPGGIERNREFPNSTIGVDWK